MSISNKIIGTVVLPLLVMLSLIVFFYFKVREVDHKLTLLATYTIPLSNNLEQLVRHSFEQELEVERALKLIQDPNEKVDLAEIISEFKAQFKEEAAAADANINQGINNAADKFHRDALKDIKLLLAKVAVQHDVCAVKLKDLMNPGNFSDNLKAYQLQERKLDNLLDKLDEKINHLQSQDAVEVMVAEITTHDVWVFLAVLTFIAGVVLSPLISKRVVEPLRRLITGTESITDGNLEVELPVKSNDEVGVLSDAFNKMALGLRQKEIIQKTFGKYIDKRIVERLIEFPEELEEICRRKHEVTVFFSDIAGFTTISEDLGPQALVKLINCYFTMASEPIIEEKGIIDKFIGDAVMAYWGAPFTNDEEHAKASCRTALRQFAQLDLLNNLEEVKQTGHKLGIRIGLSTGEVIIGNIGSEETKSFTVMGDTVNVAARLEAANKEYGTSILISQKTFELAGEDFVTRRIDKVLLKGKTVKVFIYELLGVRGKVDDTVLKLKESYESALENFENESIDLALKGIQKCLEIDPVDLPSQKLHKRILEAG